MTTTIISIVLLFLRLYRHMYILWAHNTYIQNNEMYQDYYNIYFISHFFCSNSSRWLVGFHWLLRWRAPCSKNLISQNNRVLNSEFDGYNCWNKNFHSFCVCVCGPFNHYRWTAGNGENKSTPERTESGLEARTMLRLSKPYPNNSHFQARREHLGTESF